MTSSQTGGRNNFIYMLWYCDVIANWKRQQLCLYALILWRHGKLEEGKTVFICSDIWRHRKLEVGTALFICSDIVMSPQTGRGNSFIYMLCYCDVIANWKRQQIYLYALLLWRHRKLKGGDLNYMLWHCNVLGNWNREELYLCDLTLWRLHRMEEGMTLYVLTLWRPRRLEEGITLFFMLWHHGAFAGRGDDITALFD